MSQLLAWNLAKFLNLFKLRAVQEEMLSRQLGTLVSSSDERLELEITVCVICVALVVDTGLQWKLRLSREEKGVA